MPTTRTLRVFAFAAAAISFSQAQSYLMTTVAGTSRLLDGRPAVSVPLRYPFGVAEDASGNIYFADTDDNRIRRVDPAGIITTVAGTGAAGFSGDGGPAIKAALNAPQGVKLDNQGNLFVADYSNKRVRKIALASGIITTVAGSGKAQYSGDGGPAISAGMDPFDIAVDGAGNLYIADFFNNRIREVSGGMVTTIAGTGYAGDGDLGRATLASLNGPRGISVSSNGRVYFVDSFNNRVKQIDVGANYISTAIGSVDYGTGQPWLDGDGGAALSAALFFPFSTAVEPNGNVLLACSQEIWRLTVNDGVLHSIAGDGSEGFAGDGMPGFLARFEQPAYIASGPNGDVLIADTGNFRVRRIRLSVVSTVAGMTVPDNVPATASFLNLPDGVAPDGSGGILISDSANSRVRSVSPAGVISTFAGTGVRGNASGELFFPEGMAVDAQGTVYLADTANHRVLRIAARGAPSVFAGGNGPGFSGDGSLAARAQLSSPTGVAVDGSGNVYIADSGNARIRVVDSHQNISTLAGTGVPGFSGDSGPAALARIALNDVAYYGGSLYLADEFNQRIRKIDLSTKIITTVAGNGNAGYSGDGGPALGASLNVPRSVALDGAGNLYIADWGNAVVRRVSNGIITTIAGNGQPAFNVETGTALGVSVDPTRIAVDRDGTIYIADESNDRIRRLRPQIAASWGAIAPFSGGAGSTIPISVKIVDAAGIPVGNVEVSFTVKSGPATLASQTTLTGGDGVATVQLALGPDTGTATVTATAAGLGDATLTVNVTDAPPAPRVPQIDPNGVIGSGFSMPPILALSPGGIGSVQGRNFGLGAQFQSLKESDLADGRPPTNFRGICVTVGGTRAPILGASDTQVNFQTPAASTGSASVMVIAGCDTPDAQQSNTEAVAIQSVTPEFFYFSYNSDGRDPVAAQDPMSGASLAAANLFPGAGIVPAKPGEYVTVYGTGFGATDPPFAPGEIPAGAAPVIGTVEVTLGGRVLPPSNVLYAGITPGIPGLYQVNLLLPGDTPDGDLPIVISIGGIKSPPGAFLTVLRGGF